MKRARYDSGRGRGAMTDPLVHRIEEAVSSAVLTKGKDPGEGPGDGGMTP